MNPRNIVSALSQPGPGQLAALPCGDQLRRRQPSGQCSSVGQHLDGDSIDDGLGVYKIQTKLVRDKNKPVAPISIGDRGNRLVIHASIITKYFPAINTFTESFYRCFISEDVKDNNPMHTHHRNAIIDGLNIFYRESGPANAPTIVLLHGFPSSSHMYRELIPRLADRYHVIAPDYIGFGYSSMPSVAEFEYTFDNLTAVIETLLFGTLGLERFSIYVQDYGAPVGFRIAAKHPDAIMGIVVQNGNAYVEGISQAFEPMKPFWADRNTETELPVRQMLAAGTTKFQYTHGTRNPEAISPDAFTLDQLFLDRPGNDAIQLNLLHNYPTNVGLYDDWHRYFRQSQPPTLIVWGRNDPFFTEDGARAFLRDLPGAELHLLDTGHFALEEDVELIAGRIREFLSRMSQ